MTTDHEKRLTTTDIVDAHTHLWLRQDTWVDGQRILTLKNGRSLFMGEEVQMLPPFMTDGANRAETLLSNMDYAQVGAAVVVQELIDGCQNDYLAEVQRRYPDRLLCMGMAWNTEQAEAAAAAGLRGIAVPAHRMHDPLPTLLPMFKYMEQQGLILSVCLADDERQVGQMGDIISECPQLKVAIGHFGMVTTPSFEQQVKLALRGDNVRIEAGGITWLFHKEFYPYPTAVRSICQAADWVGWDRLMWGSDYPRTITAITYRMAYDFVSRSSLLTDEQKARFLGGNAKDFYGFGQLPQLPYVRNMSE